MRNILSMVLLFTLFFTFQSIAQLHPKSYEYNGFITSNSEIQTVLLPVVNGDSLKRADTLLKYENRVGIRQHISINPELQGTIDELPDGGRLWRMRFVSPGATTHSFLFSIFHLEQDVEMWIYGEDANFEVKGPYTSKNNKQYRRFTVGSTIGSIHIIEIYEPSSAIRQSKLLLTAVYQGYRGSSSPPPPYQEQSVKQNPKDKNIQRNFGGSNSGSTVTCNPNINCSYGEEWCREKYAVCEIEKFDEEHSTVCTGTLVNNTANDKKPYVLSAWHCVDTDEPDCDLSSGEIEAAEDWVFVFNWWSNRDDCPYNGTSAEANANINGKEYHGAILRAQYRN